MKGTSSRQGSKGEREIIKNNLHNKLKEEPYLSGAHIRDLVRKLSSSRIKDPISPNKPNIIGKNQFYSHQNLAKFGEVSSEGQRTVPPQYKKQVRRRLHTTRPYQERLLNMAEARREIVTALKLHRATMKKQDNDHQQQQRQPQQQDFDPYLDSSSHEENIKSRKHSRTCSKKESEKYPSDRSNLSPDTTSHSPFYPLPWSNSYSYWPGTQIANFPDDLNFSLPSQPLGLNLNFQEFSNLDRTFYENTNNNSSSYASPKSNMVSSEGETSNVILKWEQGSEGESSGLGLHQAIDEEEMADIRTVGQKHEDDTINLVTSAKWYTFLTKCENETGNSYSPFADEVAEFPDWLNADNYGCLDQDYVNDNYSSGCLQDPPLPGLDIGEIEGVDGEWFP